MIQGVQEIARQTLANCDSFQSLVSASTASRAAEMIYHDAWPKPQSGLPEHTLAEIQALRPCAIVYTEDDRGFVANRDASADICWHISGIIHIVIFRNVPVIDVNDPSNVDVDFRTIIGNILSDLINLSETAGMLASRRITFEGPWRTDVKDLKSVGDAQAAKLIIEWGVM